MRMSFIHSPGNQKRIILLEPGALVIFVADIMLIRFSQLASKVIVDPGEITFIWWTPEIGA